MSKTKMGFSRGKGFLTAVDKATEAEYASSDHSKGTIEERLTALGFKQGSAEVSLLLSATRNVIYKQGNFVYGRFTAAVVSGVEFYGESAAFTIPSEFRICALAKTRLDNEGYFPCVLKISKYSVSAGAYEAAGEEQGWCKFNEDGTVQIVDWEYKEPFGTLTRVRGVDVIFGYQIK